MRPFVIFVLFLSLTRCAPCSEDKLAEAASPRGRYVAVTFVRNCGATSTYFYHVNIRESSKQFSPELSGTVTEGEVFGASNTKVDIMWENEETLIIDCPDCFVNQRIQLKSSLGDVKILYRPGKR